MVIEVLLLATSILIVFVSLQRLRRVEEQRDAAAAELQRTRREDPEQEALAAAGMLTNELCQMIISPLTVILGQCELARVREESDRRLDTIERQARRIADVVERHRGLAPERHPEVSEVDPVEAVHSAIRAVSGLAAERDVRIHEMIESVPSLRTNSFLLAHALRHLLRAGIEAAPKGVGDVTIATGLLPLDGEPRYVAFAVADDGPGIEPEQLPRVFHPFPEEGGTWRGAGFSYAIVYAVARAMGADLVLDSAPGAGTRATLKVALPVAAERPASGAAASEQEERLVRLGLPPQ